MHLCTMYRKRFGRQKGKNTFIFHQNDLMDQCRNDRIPHLTMALVKCRVILIYDRVWNRKNWFEIIVFLPIEWEISRAGKFKFRSNFQASKVFWIFVFAWNSRSWSSAFEIQKGHNSKIIFPIPYPIIYIPG